MKHNPEHAFLSLLESYKGIIYKISYAYAVTPEDRKDLFQEIVVSLWKAYPSFKENSKLSTWIYRVALYTAITNYRREKKQIQYEPFRPGFHEKSTADFFCDQQEEIKNLYRAIEKLSHIDKAIILLLLEENSYTEISHIIGIKPATVGMRIKRAKDKLSDLLLNIKA